MENKFNLTREQNVFVAKRNIVDYIWKSANLEGIGVTYSETQSSPHSAASTSPCYPPSHQSSELPSQTSHKTQAPG